MSIRLSSTAESIVSVESTSAVFSTVYSDPITFQIGRRKEMHLLESAYLEVCDKWGVSHTRIHQDIVSFRCDVHFDERTANLIAWSFGEYFFKKCFGFTGVQIVATNDIDMNNLNPLCLELLGVYASVCVPDVNILCGALERIEP